MTDGNKVGNKQFADFVQSNNKRHEVSEKRIEVVEDVVMELKKAFPAEDFEAHRRYHELEIRKALRTERLIRLLEERTIVGLVWLFVLWFGHFLWQSGLDAVTNIIKSR